MSMMNKEHDLYCCPICGESHDLRSHDHFDVEKNTYVRSNLCQKCSCRWDVSVEGLIYNMSIQDYEQFRNAIKGSIKESEKDEYKALKDLFNLMEIRAVKRRTRNIHENVIDIICCNVNNGQYFNIDTLSKEVYNEHFKVLFEKE